MTMEASAQQDVESPCVRACMIDQVHGYCVGCWRTLIEISYWHKYDAAQKHAVLAETETRRVIHSTIT